METYQKWSSSAEVLRPTTPALIPFLAWSLGFLSVGSGALESEESESELESEEEEDEAELLEEEDERVELDRFVGIDVFLAFLRGFSVPCATWILSVW